MDTKLKGDIAEQAVIFQALKKEWNVLKPIGDRLPYDLVLHINNVFVRIQVKSAWWDKNGKNFCIDTRRSKTNRKHYLIERYNVNDFDFAVIFIEPLDIYYIMPIEIFLSYKSSITLIEENKRQRKPKSAEFRNNWNLIENFVINRTT